MEVYLDNSATTRCSDHAREVICRTLTEDYGNPSSMHMKGVEAEKYVKEATAEIAKTLRCQEKELVFTSGGTESNNMAILGGALANRRRGKHLITTAVEHPSVKKPMEFLKEQGYEISYLSVDREGRISPEELKNTLRPDTILVSIMMVNNEIGALEPIAEAGKLVHEYDSRILFHVDAIQAYGKFRIVPKRMDIDLLSASSHKIHGPKGVGFLFIKDKCKIRPIVFGGGQQKDMRSGTINAPGIAGMGAAAADCYRDFETQQDQLYRLREYFIGKLQQLEDVQINGRTDRECAPHIVSASFPGIRSEVLLHSLEDRGVYVSAGSACASNHPSTSNTLAAIGLDEAHQESTLRFSFSDLNTEEELDYTYLQLKELLPMLRRYRRR